MIILKTEYAHSLKPEFIRRVVIEGRVRTRNGYEYEIHEYGNTGNYFITRKDALTGDIVKVCDIKVVE